MRANELQELRSKLHHRRRLILDATRRADAEVDALRAAERDPEVMEGSQREQEQATLVHLGEVEHEELARIDAALARLEAGAYGVCRDCGAEIPAARLAALPHALECSDCAAERELAREAALAVAATPRLQRTLG
jgi:DnaK suppressor protein